MLDSNFRNSIMLYPLNGYKKDAVDFFNQTKKPNPGRRTSPPEFGLYFSISPDQCCLHQSIHSPLLLRIVNSL